MPADRRTTWVILSRRETAALLALAKRSPRLRRSADLARAIDVAERQLAWLDGAQTTDDALPALQPDKEAAQGRDRRAAA